MSFLYCIFVEFFFKAKFEDDPTSSFYFSFIGGVPLMNEKRGSIKLIAHNNNEFARYVCKPTKPTHLLIDFLCLLNMIVPYHIHFILLK